MIEDPFFSIILAAYNRGRLIAPTIDSILAQTDRAFELIVVGDGCTDDTGDIVRSFGSPRITWVNLPENHGCQSAANNHGQRSARGAWTAYVGHDDIWTPGHLAAIRERIGQDPAASFVASGCIFHGPPDSGVYFVTGLFDESKAAARHFFPPSSLAHRRDVVTRIGEWRDPRSIALPVDSDFQLRGVEAGLRFVSTGRVTVHKFAAGHRYLSYLRPDADEQAAMLHRFGAGFDRCENDWIARAKDTGRFMTMSHPPHGGLADGQLFARSRAVKGLLRVPLEPLRGNAVLRQSDEPRAFDWYPRSGESAVSRWSGPNPRPKILLPFTGTRANVAIEIVGLAHGAWIGDVEVYVEGERAECRLGRGPTGHLELRLVARLRPDDYTVLTLYTPVMGTATADSDSDGWRRIGVAVESIAVSPAG